MPSWPVLRFASGLCCGVGRKTALAKGLNLSWVPCRTAVIRTRRPCDALEHFTACLAVLALDHGLVDDAEPRAKRLLQWHAAEEIEHREIAYDLLLAVDPRYRTRVAGFVLASLVLNGFLASAWWYLLRQEAGLVGWPSLARDVLNELRDLGPRRCLPKLLPAVFAYLAPGFHPSREPGHAGAERFLASAEWRPEAAA
jgi:hypothetical protein